MVSSPKHKKLKLMLLEAIRVLCGQEIKYKSEFSVEGLLGVTVDKSEVFLINVNETITEDNGPSKQLHQLRRSNNRASRTRRSYSNSAKSHAHDEISPPTTRGKKRRHTGNSDAEDISEESYPLESEAGLEDETIDDIFTLNDRLNPTATETAVPTVLSDTKSIVTNTVVSTSNNTIPTTSKPQVNTKGAAKTTESVDPEKELRDLTCIICQTVFPNKSELSLHIGTSHDNLLICRYCGESHESSQILKQHELWHKQQKKLFVCKVCQMGFVNRQGLLDHRTIHTEEFPYQCERCGMSYKQIAALENHLVKCGTVNKTPHQCDNCSASYSRKKDLQEHKKEAHLIEEKIYCECGKPYATKESIAKHRRSCQVYSWHIRQQTDISNTTGAITQQQGAIPLQSSAIIHHQVTAAHSSTSNQQQMASLTSGTINVPQAAPQYLTSTINQHEAAALARDTLYAQHQMVAVGGREDANVLVQSMVPVPTHIPSPTSQSLTEQHLASIRDAQHLRDATQQQLASIRDAEHLAPARDATTLAVQHLQTAMHDQQHHVT